MIKRFVGSRGVWGGGRNFPFLLRSTFSQPNSEKSFLCAIVRVSGADIPAKSLATQATILAETFGTQHLLHENVNLFSPPLPQTRQSAYYDFCQFGFWHLINYALHHWSDLQFRGPGSQSTSRWKKRTKLFLNILTSYVMNVPSIVFSFSNPYSWILVEFAVNYAKQERYTRKDTQGKCGLEI